MGKKPYHISFHLQVDNTDPVMPKGIFKDVIQGRIFFFDKSPVITQDDFRAFQPFPSQQGFGFGAVFKLNSHGSNALNMIGSNKNGAVLRSAVNGTPVDYVIVDESAKDGKVVIWQGISPQLLALLDKSLPRIDPSTAPKKKFKWNIWKKANDSDEDFSRSGL